MHHPFAITDSKRVILLYLQIIHRSGGCDRLPAAHNPEAAIGTPHMHPDLELPSRHKALLFGQEWMLAGGMDNLALFGRGLAIMGGRLDGDREVNQIAIDMLPHMQDRLGLHLVGLRVVSHHLIAHLEIADCLFPLRRRYWCSQCETTCCTTLDMKNITFIHETYNRSWSWLCWKR